MVKKGFDRFSSGDGGLALDKQTYVLYVFMYWRVFSPPSHLSLERE